MEKKHVSIVGSCVSRELFNDPRMKEVFDIDLYAFKVCPWALFDEGLNFPVALIAKTPNKEYINRMLCYEINKTTIGHLRNAKSDYLFLDLYSMFERVYRVSYKGKSVYMQCHVCKKALNNLKTSLGEQGDEVQVSEINIEEIDKNIVLDGLKRLAEFANENYKKVIISWPTFAKQYLSFDGTIKEYRKFDTSFQNCIDYYSKYLSARLRNKILLKWKPEYKARVFYSDFQFVNNPNFEPDQVHLLDEHFEELVNHLLLRLKLNYKEYYTLPLEYKSYKTEKLSLETSKFRALVERLQTEILCNIQMYTNFLKTLNHHLIVITSQDDASRYIKYYINRFTLGLRFDIRFRDSFVAIIDTKNNYKFEKRSPEAIEMSYEIPNSSSKVEVVSHGFKAGRLSSVKFDGDEMSKNKRGLNFFVLDLDTMKVVDRASCDLYGDEFLLMDSDYFSATKTRN